MKILYIISSYNLYGGTPMKTLALLNYFKTDGVVYLYVDEYQEFRDYFEQTGSKMYEGFHKRNLFLHIRKLREIIKKEKIDIIQSHFPMGEFLGGILKMMYPEIKLIISFEGAGSPKVVKKYLLANIYKSVDAFIYISNFVKQEKLKVFPLLEKKKNKIIYIGTNQNMETPNKINNFMKHPALFDIAGLTLIKNHRILIDAVEVLINKGIVIYLYLAGDGPMKISLDNMIRDKELSDYIHILGYCNNTDELTKECDIFVHPCYFEGFGMVVAEAMMAQKPIIVSNAGALPELVEHNKSGLIVDPYNAEEWANAIQKLLNNQTLSKKLAKNAKIRAEKLFSIEKFVQNYQNLYEELLEV